MMSIVLCQIQIQLYFFTYRLVSSRGKGRGYHPGSYTRTLLVFAWFLYQDLTGLLLFVHVQEKIGFH